MMKIIFYIVEYVMNKNVKDKVFVWSIDLEKM